MAMLVYKIIDLPGLPCSCTKRYTCPLADLYPDVAPEVLVRLLGREGHKTTGVIAKMPWNITPFGDTFKYLPIHPLHLQVKKLHHLTRSIKVPILTWQTKRKKAKKQYKIIIIIPSGTLSLVQSIYIPVKSSRQEKRHMSKTPALFCFAPEGRRDTPAPQTSQPYQASPTVAVHSKASGSRGCQDLCPVFARVAVCTLCRHQPKQGVTSHRPMRSCDLARHDRIADRHPR